MCVAGGSSVVGETGAELKREGVKRWEWEARARRGWPREKGVGKGSAAEVQPVNGAGPCGPEMGVASSQNMIMLILQWSPNDGSETHDRSENFIKSA